MDLEKRIDDLGINKEEEQEEQDVQKCNEVCYYRNFDECDGKKQGNECKQKKNPKLPLSPA